MRRLSRLVGSGRESTVPLLLHPTRRDREGQAGLMETALSGTSRRGQAGGPWPAMVSCGA